MSLQPGPDDPTADSSLTPAQDVPAPSPEVPAAAPEPDSGSATPPAGPSGPPAAEGASPARETAPPPPPPAGYGAPASGWDAAPPPPPPAGYGAPPPAAPPGYGPPAVPGYPDSGWSAAQPPAGYGPSYPPGQYAAAPQTDSKATIGLVLALVSWVMCPIILAVAALVVAGQSNRAIDASGGRLEGRGLNTATKWISWINIVLYGLGLVALLVFFGWLATQPDLINEITNDPATQF